VAVPYIRSEIRDSDPQVAKIAGEALQRVGANAVPSLVVLSAYGLPVVIRPLT
jgi:hypothetical protein